jgi:Mitochondrial glycoprotein
MKRFAKVTTAMSSRGLVSVRAAQASSLASSPSCAGSGHHDCRTTATTTTTRRSYACGGFGADRPFTSASVAYRPSSSSLLWNASAPNKYYSTSAPAFMSSSSSSSLLAEILTREKAEEIENDTLAVPPELADLKAKLEGGGDGGWKIVDVGATTRLTKPLAGRGKVVVHFHCQDIIEDLDEHAFDDEDDPAEGSAPGGSAEDEEEEEEEEVAGAVRFVVAVSYPAQKTLVFQCVTDFGQVQIRSASATAQSADELFQQGGGGGAAASGDLSIGVGDPKDYQGPVFDELAEDLQQAFHQYLAQEIGVNEDVAAFVSMHADHREQANYVRFLDECHGVVAAAAASSS